MWSRRPNKVLIVARDPAAAGLSPAFLQHSGIDLHHVAGGSAALDAARRELPRLIVQQVDAPPDEAIALARGLKNDPHTAAIPLIAVADERLGDELTAAGVDAIVNRPLVLREYWDAVRRFVHLPRRRALRESINLRFTYVESERRSQAFSRDLSPYGAFLKTDQHVSVGARITVRFNLPGDPVAIECSAIVRGTCYADAHTAGFAIEFEGMAETDVARLERFVDRSQQRGLFGVLLAVVVPGERPG
ncbi:MAG TPA: PilZ domain-containing protein [Candidatus Polarisedimenticolaceae bacterium]|nr:PilZ domain-containing protein [Candidatus Polarisedimenticolaceae bacterium]